MRVFVSALICLGLLLGVGSPALAGNDRIKDKVKVKDKIEIADAITLKPANDLPRPISATPEPSSALVFGAGLLVASQIARKRRR